MTYKFTPLPAAYPMKWCELLTPVQKAVRDLLVLIDGAEKTIKSLNNSCSKNKKELGNCFLVYGARGTGKTTVLLSAQEATNKNNTDFFEKQSAGEGKEIQKNDAKDLAEKLKRIEWLDVLDLEPLPEEANLLATLLTRVRNALESDDNELNSILEEDSESARQQLTRLIHDATFMWENIREEDTRSIASRQVAAAEIYAEFRPRFKKAMDALTKELGRRSGARGESRSIVLPIDNIDRSTYHLEAIVKLAQLVSHRRLWLVMAGDRVEVETFLERAYWKELIHSRVGINTRGKESAEGEDETLVMARRQAAATSKKLWPSSHRIEIDFVAPEETLRFSLPGSVEVSLPGSVEENVTIYNLLSEVPIPHSGFEKKDKDIRLIDLLRIRNKIVLNPLEYKFLKDDIKNSTFPLEELKRFLNRIDSQVELPENNDKQSLVSALNKIIQEQDFREKVSGNKEIESKLSWETLAKADQLQGKTMPDLNRMILEDLFSEHITKRPGIRKPFLTRAAQHGLHLPARGVLDLWQLAYWVVKDNKPSEFDFSAEKIARTMLRNAIAGSRMPSTMGRYLQDKIIQRTEKGGTSLLFYEQTAILDRCFLCSVRYEFRGSNDKEQINCRFGITLNNVQNEILILQRKKDEKKDSEKESEVKPRELPGFVTAWLAILHDILLLEYIETEQENPSGSAVVYEGCDLGIPPFVEIKHNWAVLEAEGKKEKLKAYKLKKEIRWPMPKWDTFWEYDIFRERWEQFISNEKQLKLLDKGSDATEKLLLTLSTGWIDCVLKTYKALKKLEKDDTEAIIWGRVITEADQIYTQIQKERKSGKGSHDALTTELIKWMEKDLPLFMSYLYVPYNFPEKGKKNQRVEYIENKFKCFDEHPGSNENKLFKYWYDNRYFILVKIEEELEKYFTPLNGRSRKRKKIPLRLVGLPFEDLRDLCLPDKKIVCDQYPKRHDR